MLRATRQHLATVMDAIADIGMGTVAGMLAMSAGAIVTRRADTFTAIERVLGRGKSLSFELRGQPVVADFFRA